MDNALDKKIDLLYDKFSFYLKQNKKILIACSGGIDSMVLLNLLLKFKAKNTSYQNEIVVLHYINKWENIKKEYAEEEKNAQRMIKDYCLKNNLLCVIGEDAVIKNHKAKQSKGSLEATSREERIAFFEKQKTRLQADLVFLGHHKDDNIENFLIRLTRSASLEGLCGIREQNNYYIRPMIKVFSKKDIEKIAALNMIPFIEDTSNKNDRFLRNKIRSQLLPLWNSIDLRASQSLENIIENLQDAHFFIEEYSQKVFVQCIDMNELSIDIDLFLKESLVIQKNIFFNFLIVLKWQGISKDSLFYEFLKYIKKPKNSIKHIIGNNIQIELIKKSIYFKLIQI